MKITKSQLRQIIKEELEEDELLVMLNALDRMLAKVDPKRLTDAAKIKSAEISKKLKGVIQALGAGRTAEIDDWEYEKNLEEVLSILAEIRRPRSRYLQPNRRDRMADLRAGDERGNIQMNLNNLETALKKQDWEEATSLVNKIKEEDSTISISVPIQSAAKEISIAIATAEKQLKMAQSNAQAAQSPNYQGYLPQQDAVGQAQQNIEKYKIKIDKLNDILVNLKTWQKGLSK